MDNFMNNNNDEKMSVESVFLKYINMYGLNAAFSVILSKRSLNKMIPNIKRTYATLAGITYKYKTNADSSLVIDMNNVVGNQLDFIKIINTISVNDACKNMILEFAKTIYERYGLNIRTPDGVCEKLLHDIDSDINTRNLCIGIFNAYQSERLFNPSIGTGLIWLTIVTACGALRWACNQLFEKSKFKILYPN